MSAQPYVTRFAPSPTGALHLGNARTALFNDLAARASGGRMVLRIEDTDAERSDDALLAHLLEDLRWLGLQWAEGPDVGGAHGPYRQSERGDHYAAAIATLEAAGRVYPCFCTPDELRLSRKVQLASGRPPRYAGTCASLSAQEVARRVAAGERPALRFRVPAGLSIEFDDLVHGPQRFASDDIGDFVIRRADGSVAFFLGNAVDDAEMGINLVLRGDDHLANTPRQIMLLQALGRPLPGYGHLPLLLGANGAPLSKRDGAASLGDLRAQGYLPGALRNYLVRLGHPVAESGWLETDALAQHFDLARSSRSAAHFDEAQLRHWQREAVGRASEAASARVAVRTARAARRHRASQRIRRGGARQSDVPGGRRATGGAGMRRRGRVRRRGRPRTRSGRRRLLRAGCWQRGAQMRQTSRPGRARSGPPRRAKAPGSIMPLRAALTGTTHGPELAPLVALMGHERVAARLASAAARAAAH